jgi:hypothetical protein
MTLVDITALRELHPRLYRTVTKTLKITGAGEREIDFFDLDQFTRGELFEWQTQHEFNLKKERFEEHAARTAEATRRAAEAARRAAAPPPAPEPEPVAPAELPEQIDIGAYEREQLQRATDESRGLARLHQFQQEQGLRDCKENADAIRNWLDANVRGYVSAAGIDAAVVNLGARGKNVLLWDSVAPPPAPPAAEPVEVLGTLKDGSKQLPLDADEFTQRKASVVQLQDLVSRRRTATGQRFIGRGVRTNRLASKF